MKWKEGDLIPRYLYDDAIFKLEMAMQLDVIKNKKPPAKPIPPSSTCGDGCYLSFDVYILLRQYRIPLPPLPKNKWYQIWKD